MKRTNKTGTLKMQDALQLNSVILYFKLANSVLKTLKNLLYKRNGNPPHILIFRTGSLGDSLCAIPIIAAIRKKYPAAKIDILTNPGKSTLVSIGQLLSPALFDNIINYHGLNSRKTISSLRKEKYDLVVQLPQVNAPFWRLARDLFFFRLIASAGWGWEIGYVSFFRKVQEKYIVYDTELVRLSKLALRNNLGVDINDFPLNITTADVSFVDQQYQQLALSDRKIIGVVVGAKRPQNRWPINYFREVINYFSADYNIVIIGGKEDKELASKVCIHPHVFNLCGVFTPMQSAAALKKCCVVLSNDTGPMHLSYMSGTPTVALFSSRDFKGAWFPPENEKNIVFRSENIPCALCLTEYCANNICMQAIKPSIVSTAMSNLITKTCPANI